MLYLAMEDFRVDVILGKGAGATAVPIDLPPFTLIGATTRSGALPSPLRDRFGFTAAMEFYEAADLGKILQRSANLIGIEIDESSRSEIAKRSRGTPRVANRLLRRVRDYREVHSGEKEFVNKALELYEVDPIGLDRMDRDFLKVLINNFNGGPAGLTTIALAIGEEPETLESIVEPYLVRIGFLARTPRGRIVTKHAYQHFGLTPPIGFLGGLEPNGGNTLFGE
jgi:Holliday junction DNA helicase RuvB